MAPSTCDHGVGAIVLALIHFIHPSEHIRQKFPNPVTGQRLSDCETIQQELKKVLQRDQLIIVVHHTDFKTDDGDFIYLYAVKQYWKVQKAGDVDLRFDVAPTNEGGGQGEEMVPLPAALTTTSMATESTQLKLYKMWSKLMMTMIRHQKTYHNEVTTMLLCLESGAHWFLPPSHAEHAQQSCQIKFWYRHNSR